MILATLISMLLMLPNPSAEQEKAITATIDRITRSARVSQIGQARDNLEDPRQLVAPGAPPIVSFRYFAGAERHRFGNLDLVIDDAGH